MKVGLVCIAKLEYYYIEEFVTYHLLLGFDTIYIYDNEDLPTYYKILKDYLNYIKIIHLPGNEYEKGVQYIALDHFIKNFMYKDNLTHICHIDCDEFIALKKHKKIKDFIKEYIKGDCAGIGMNWRYFGSNGLKKYNNRPILERFTKCDKYGDKHIKTLFDVSKFSHFLDCHSIMPKNNYKIKNTLGREIIGPFNEKIDLSVIQLNHYKCKTLQEFKFVRQRGHADFNKSSQPNQNIERAFEVYNKNDVEDLAAYNFYKKFIKN